MTRYLMPNRVEADIVTDRPTEPGYVWLNHPELGLIQMPDSPKHITPSEPDDATIWLDTSTLTVWHRHDDWAPSHAPTSRWYSTAGTEHGFWPDVCRRAGVDVDSWVELRQARQAV